MRTHLGRRLSAVFALGAAGAVTWAVLGYEPRHGWILLLMLASLTTLFVTKRRLSLLFTGAPFLMLTGMVFGTRYCVLAAAAFALLSAFILYTSRAAASRTIWSCVALMICEAFLYSSAYHFVRSWNLFLAILAAAAVSYLATSLIRDDNERWTDRLPLIFNPFLAASCAAFIAPFYREDSLAPLVGVPAAVVIWHWTKLHESRIRVGVRDTSALEQPQMR